MSRPNHPAWSDEQRHFIQERATVAGPDGLTTSWLYDAFGRLVQETRPLGSTTFSYTACGTCWPLNAVYSARAQDTDGSDNFEFFDELGRTVGKSWKAPLGTEGRQETRYSALGFVSQVSQPYLLAEPVYWTSYLYDVIGRLTSENAPVSELQPSGATTLYDYRGHALWITDAENNTTKYTHNAARQIKQVVDAMNGTTAYTYKHFGELATFTHDEVGNVLTRTNAKISKTETFTYDDLNRLSTMQVSGLSTVTMGYSAAGRITSRTDLGTYTYTGGCGGGPFAVKNAAGKAYCYDAAGRMTSRGGSAITWFSYDLPKKINHGTASSEFTYGVDRARVTQVRKTGSTTDATITYIGDLVEREVAGGTTTWRHYVSAGGRVVAQVNRVNTTNTAQYLHRDHQGSVVEVTNASGGLVQSLAHDAWGLRRNPSNWAPLPTPFGGTQPTKRGYTGHEHLDNVELIHMNGRVQDPRIGRFISADPFIQAPYRSQSHNRYSYVWNNPLTLVDPSGFQAGEEGGGSNFCQENPYICNNPCANWGACELHLFDSTIDHPTGFVFASSGAALGMETSQHRRTSSFTPQGLAGGVMAHTGALPWPGRPSGGIPWGGIGEGVKQAGKRLGARVIPVVGTIASVVTASRTDEDRWTYYHGTTSASAEALLAGAPLALEIAMSEKIDGDLGFYLASNYIAAEFYASRRPPGGILQYSMTESARNALISAGSVERPIPIGQNTPPAATVGSELFVPPMAFALFDSLRQEGRIVVAPARDPGD